MPENDNKHSPKIALVGEFSPPHAGMAVQAELLLDRLPNSGLSIKQIVTNYHFKGFISWLNRVKYIRGLIRLLLFVYQCRTIFSVDIVHIFSSSGINFYIFSAIPILISRIFNKKVVINYHGGNAERFFNNRQSLLSWALQGPTTLVVPSGFLQDVFSRLGHQSAIIPNVINVEQFEYRERSQFLPKILSCRNFTPVYNVACAVRVHAIIETNHPNASLVLAGDGPLRESLESLVKTLNLKNVTFLGNIPNKQMNEVYTGADIFLNTSNVDNMPNCILEAFACGLPVVSTDVGGIPFIVEDGETGLLAPANDHEKLAEHILMILENHDLAKKMVKSALLSFDSYGWQNVSHLWMKHYDTISSGG